jgi:WD40 repeat protein
MDSKIVLYSLAERYLVRIIEGEHSKGARRLSYCPLNGGYLISTGYEVYANVWCPEAVVGQIMIGKLKGHSRPIIDTKFIGTSPFNVTIDESREIRIWDIRICTCMEVVKSRIYTVPQGIISLSNHVFWVYGKKFI